MNLDVCSQCSVTFNLWAEVGLCKEAMGEVKSLIHNLPVEALVKFDNCNGSTFYNTDLVLTCPVNLESCSVENCECQQIPLKITGQ